MGSNKLRWGILSTANIARKNWKAIANTGNGTVAAVASREQGRAARFIDECQGQAPMEARPRALGSYEALLADREVDALYIPLPTGLRKEWVLRAAAAGKHIVCEKPCADSAADLREMIEACRRHRVQFMDGVMFMHSARLLRMREALDDGGSVGAIRRITTSFSFRAGPEFFAGNIRANSVLERAGCLGDLGWYCIRFALWAMGWQLPHRVTGRILQEFQPPGGGAGIPTEFTGELIFADGVSSGFYCSFLTAMEQRAAVHGDAGYLRLDDFVLPFHGPEIGFEVNSAAFDIQGCDFRVTPNWRRVTVQEHSAGHPTAQETNLFRNFAAQISAGGLQEAWPEMALKTQQVMDACFDSARQGRPVDL